MNNDLGSISFNNMEDVVKNDNKKFPHCGYSTSSSMKCNTTEEGHYVCETIKSIQRLCPGERPIVIYNEKEQNSSTDHQTFSNPSFDSFSNHQRDDIFNNFNLKGIFKEFEDSFNMFPFLGSSHNNKSKSNDRGNNDSVTPYNNRNNDEFDKYKHRSGRVPPIDPNSIERV